MGLSERTPSGASVTALREVRAKPRSPGDQTIIHAVLEGDTRVAGLLYDRLYPVVDRTLVRIMGGRGSDHEDLVQQVFEQIVLTLTRRRFAGACSLSRWGAVVATNVAISSIRKRVRERRWVDRSCAEPPSGWPAPEGERWTAERIDLRRVQEALGRMDPKKAEALVLHDVFGHQLSEIAVLTGASVAATQSRLVRGRRDLSRRLQRPERG
jgi:RNA polymerase sigma-70 factor, ECF subfamily